jgi:hypothetical protein
VKINHPSAPGRQSAQSKYLIFIDLENLFFTPLCGPCLPAYPVERDLRRGVVVSFLLFFFHFFMSQFNWDETTTLAEIQQAV